MGLNIIMVEFIIELSAPSVLLNFSEVSRSSVLLILVSNLSLHNSLQEFAHMIIQTTA